MTAYGPGRALNACSHNKNDASFVPLGRGQAGASAATRRSRRPGPAAKAGALMSVIRMVLSGLACRPPGGHFDRERGGKPLPRASRGLGEVSFFSRFFVKFVEVTAAGLATAISAYLLAHFGGFLLSSPTPPSPPAPPPVQVGPTPSQGAHSRPPQPTP